MCCAWCSWDDHLCAVLGAHGMIICWDDHLYTVLGAHGMIICVLCLVLIG